MHSHSVLSWPQPPHLSFLPPPIHLQHLDPQSRLVSISPANTTHTLSISHARISDHADHDPAAILPSLALPLPTSRPMPRRINFQPLKDFRDSLLFYLAILPLAVANPNVLKDRDSRREKKKVKEKEDAKADEVKGGERPR